MGRGIFSYPVEVTGFLYPWKYFLSHVYLKDLSKNLKEIEISKLHRVWAKKIFQIMKFEYIFLCENLKFSAKPYFIIHSFGRALVKS